MANAKLLAAQLPGFFTVAEAGELPENNTFTINFAEQAEVGQGPKAEDKPVLGFTETKKRLVLNKGRCQQLAALFGDEELIGKVIRLTVQSLQSREQIVIVSAE